MIKVLFFAGIKEQAGRDVYMLDSSEMTVSELLAELEKTFSLQLPESLMVAVDEEYAEHDEVIKAGSTAALIPPVSGG
ncbi:molybdopterin converting factor subunit 1 [Metabacillus sp. GX 13764]|uniref:molybdopterin converting factor subunit 1 n=1 Tax=Metabacillus kandeliae TaxID=2900151 RepID=UPI001E47BA1B|nr:molybdopterin converting factor subunit 1 [Metabacillus kandeliae]MCD7033569.1 molybdopterin converting factor subunit 1 [Metabacillus kandeliae]